YGGTSNVTSKTDPRGNTVTYEYDKLGNVSHESQYADVRGVNALVSINRTHNRLGLLTEETWTKEGGSVHKDYAYDWANQLMLETFPGGHPAWVFYHYNTRGQLAERDEGGG